MSYCSPDLNSGSYPAMSDEFQSTGLCGNHCRGSYAFAIIQGYNCWCSNYVPTDQDSIDSCNQGCPGIDTESCGSTDAGLYSYFLISPGQPLGTSGGSDSSSAPATTASTSAASTSSLLVAALVPTFANDGGNGRPYAERSPKYYTYPPTTSSSPTSSETPTSTTPSSTLLDTLTTSSTPAPTEVYTSVTTVTGQGQTVVVTPSAVPSSDALGQASTATGGHGVSTGKVVGIVLGVALGIGLIIGILVWLWFRRRRRQERRDFSSEASFVADRNGGKRSGPNSSGDNSIPSRQVSQMSTAGLLGKSPKVMTSGLNGGSSDLRSAGTASSAFDRRSLGTDQRLNPWALYGQEDRLSSVSLQDNQDYSRQLRVGSLELVEAEICVTDRMARRDYGSDVSLDRSVDRYDRTYVSSRGRDRRTGDRVVEEEIYGSSGREVPRRERDVRVREEVIERERSALPPAFLREDYGRSAGAGAVVLRKRDERDTDDRSSRGILARPVSHERERSRARRDSESDQEIIIRREHRDGGRGRDREREEIIVRNHSRSNSSDSAAGRYPPGAYYQAPTYPAPTIIAAPPQHEDAIARAIDRDYEITLTPRRPASRLPSPPSPPSPAPEREREREQARSGERIAIHRSGEREGREYKEDIVIDRNDTRSRSPLPPPALRRDPYYDNGPTRAPPGPYDREAEEEAAYYNDIAKQRGYIGEAYHGATRDWSLVDVPPGTHRVRMDGTGGGEQEITWQRYNGVRRSKFYPDGAPYDGYIDGARPAPSVGAGGLGVSWGKPRDPRDGLWTEITKDLVVKEAIKEMGYEYEETDDFYYVFKYLSYEDMARLVGLSEDIKNARQKRIKEIGWENRVLPERAADPAPPRLLIEPGRDRRDHRPWASDDERYIEREIVYRGGRPPPPPTWRR
ncbi:hypothetical protein DV736_g1732, partial [Chaetothyriales sp. CBS 134916]